MSAKRHHFIIVFTLMTIVAAGVFTVGCSSAQEGSQQNRVGTSEAEYAEGDAVVAQDSADPSSNRAELASGDRAAAEAMVGRVVTEQQIAQQVGGGYELEFGESGSCELNRGISKGTFCYDGFQIEVQSKDGWEHLEVLKVHD